MSEELLQLYPDGKGKKLVDMNYSKRSSLQLINMPKTG